MGKERVRAEGTGDGGPLGTLREEEVGTGDEEYKGTLGGQEQGME